MTADPPTTGRTRRPHSAGRRFLFTGLYALFLLVLVEAGGYVGLWLLAGGPPSGAALGERMEVAAQVPVDAEPRAEADFGNGLHPYLGFMTRSRSERVSPLGIGMSQQAFYEPGSPIYERDPDVLVVGIAGGSVADRFARQGGVRVLAERLPTLPRFAGRKVRVALLAFGGWKQPQQLMALNLLLALGGRLDLLIELDGFNEVALHEGENENQRIAPFYPRGWFFLTQRHEVLPSLGELNELRRARRDRALAVRASFLRHSWARRLLWFWRDGRLERDIAERQQSLRDYEPRPASVEDRDLVLSGPLSRASSREERLDELVDVWAESSIQLERVCRANGVEYAHFLQPNQYVPDSKRLTEAERRDAFDPSPEGYAPLVRAGYPRMQRAAERLLAAGVRFRDLTPVFEGVDETIYVDDCCHVNELGNRILAEAIVEFLAAAGD